MISARKRTGRHAYLIILISTTYLSWSKYESGEYVAINQIFLQRKNDVMYKTFFLIFAFHERRKNIFFMSQHNFSSDIKEHFFARKACKKMLLTCQQLLCKVICLDQLFKMRLGWNLKNADKSHLFFILLNIRFWISKLHKIYNSLLRFRNFGKMKKKL